MNTVNLIVQEIKVAEELSSYFLQCEAGTMLISWRLVVN